MKFKKQILGVLFSALCLVSPFSSISANEIQNQDLENKSRSSKEERMKYLLDEKFKDYKEDKFSPTVDQNLYVYKETSYSNYPYLWSTPQIIIMGNKKTVQQILITPEQDNRKINITVSVTLEDVVFDELDFNSIYNIPQLSIIPLFPDIFNPSTEIKEFILEGRDIPLFYLKPKINEPHYIFGRYTLINYAFKEYILNLNDLFHDSYLKKEDFNDSTLEVLINAEITLNPYNQIDISKIGNINDLKSYKGFGKFTSEYYYPPSLKYPINHPEIKKIVNDLMHDKTNVLEVARSIYDFVIDTITPHNEELRLSVLELLEKKKGDCDDYSALFVTLMRSAGIPSKENFYIAEDKKTESHVWPEFLVPLKDGTFRWIASDPTFGEANRRTYFQFKDDKHYYYTGLEIELRQIPCYLIDKQIWVIKKN